MVDSSLNVNFTSTMEVGLSTFHSRLPKTKVWTVLGNKSMPRLEQMSALVQPTSYCDKNSYISFNSRFAPTKFVPLSLQMIPRQAKKNIVGQPHSSNQKQLQGGQP